MCRIRAGGGCLCDDGGNYLKYFKKGWYRKEGRGNKNLKKEGQAGSRSGFLKKGWEWGGVYHPYKLCLYPSEKLECNSSCTSDVFPCISFWLFSFYAILFQVRTKRSGGLYFHYFLLQRVNRFINKVINVLSLVIYCLIFSIPHVTFKRH